MSYLSQYISVKTVSAIQNFSEKKIKPESIQNELNKITNNKKIKLTLSFSNKNFNLQNFHAAKTEAKKLMKADSRPTIETFREKL